MRREKRIQPVKQRSRRRWGRSPVILILLLLVWSIVLGWGLAQATEPPASVRLPGQELAQAGSSAPASIGTIDVVPGRLQLAQDVYLESCAACHIGVPPAVLPLEAWRQVIQDSQHYGIQIKPLVDPARLLVWDYLRSFSRPLLEEEEVPYRIGDSRYFKALHPRVKVPRPLKLSSCVTCHPGASQYNFRSLTPEWENAP